LAAPSAEGPDVKYLLVAGVLVGSGSGSKAIGVGEKDDERVVVPATVLDVEPDPVEQDLNNDLPPTSVGPQTATSAGEHGVTGNTSSGASAVSERPQPGCNGVTTTAVGPAATAESVKPTPQATKPKRSKRRREVSLSKFRIKITRRTTSSNTTVWLFAGKVSCVFPRPWSC
jgi:hypothetical protein